MPGFEKLGVFHLGKTGLVIGLLEEAAVEAAGGPGGEEGMETVRLRPRKTNVAVELVALVWRPYWQKEGAASPAWE